MDTDPKSDRYKERDNDLGGRMMNFLSASESGGMGVGFWVVYAIIIVAFMYFLMIRPQKKQKKEQAELFSSMAIGDSVLTSSGFYGVIIDITDDMVIVEFGSNKNCRIPMQKSAIVQIEKPSID